MSTHITIIGGGNLGTAIAEGLLASNYCQANNLTITKRNTTTLQHLADKGVTISNNNQQAIANAEWIILAVKPFQIKEVVENLLPALTPNHKIISVVTGIWLKDLHSWLGNNISTYRAMPNTAIAIQQSMTCICTTNGSTEQTVFVSNLFNQLGKTVIIDEQLMDAATVLGACGTAYAMRFIRANIQGGIEIGFSASTASLIAAQTIKGAAQLLLEKNTHPEAEIDKVTTPKGCTIAGLNEMEHQGFSSSLIKGISASYKKIKSQDM